MADRREFNRRCREIERAAMGCLDPGTDTMRNRERAARRKVEKAEELTTDYLLALGRVDRKLADSLRDQLLPTLQSWELELDQRAAYLGDLRSLPR